MDRHQPQNNRSPADCGPNPPILKGQPLLPQPQQPAGQHKLLNTPEPTACCVRNQSHQPVRIPTLESLGPWADPRTWLCSPGPACDTAPGFTFQWSGTNPWISWTLTPPTSEPALPLECPRVPQSATSWDSMAKQQLAASVQGRNSQPIWPRSTKTTMLPTVVSPQKKDKQPTWGKILRNIALMMSRQCVVGTHWTSPTKHHFSKVRNYKQPTRYTEIKTAS